jgi:hypothetical protein
VLSFKPICNGRVMIVRPEFQAEQGTHAAGTQLVLERHEEVTVTVAWQAQILPNDLERWRRKLPEAVGLAPIARQESNTNKAER